MPLERATARIISLVTMAIIFGKSMSSLYAVTFFALFVNYFVCKLMCLEIYKTLQKPSLVKTSLNLMVLGVIAHEILGLFSITEPNMHE